MKIYVYAIAKNEAQFARRWMESMGEADGVFVLDTGSTDSTRALLSSLGAVTEEKHITPWRFDVARNESMKLIPADADICVCTDLDEVFCPGWRAALEAAWKPGTTTALYEFVWSFNPDGTDGGKFNCFKAHAPGVCRWVNAVHEVLAYDVPKVSVTVPNMRLEHYPDPAKSRGNYLALLEMAVGEDPHNDRNMHYLGREYMYQGEWVKAVETLKRHLAMPGATWPAERAASMRFIAYCWAQTGDYAMAELWLSRAIAEAPSYREAWYAAEKLAYERQEWSRCIYYGEQCVSILDRELSYITDPEPWGHSPWDMLTIAYWNTGRQADALEAGKNALRFGPENERLRDNVKIMEDILYAKCSASL